MLQLLGASERALQKGFVANSGKTTVLGERMIVKKDNNTLVQKSHVLARARKTANSLLRTPLAISSCLSNSGSSLVIFKPSGSSIRETF